jgi:hypothetical protein
VLCSRRRDYALIPGQGEDGTEFSPFPLFGSSRSATVFRLDHVSSPVPCSSIFKNLRQVPSASPAASANRATLLLRAAQRIVPTRDTQGKYDPSDDCTFFYTTEYLPNNGSFNWNTRVGSFAFPSCTGMSTFSLAALRVHKVQSRAAVLAIPLQQPHSMASVAPSTLPSAAVLPAQHAHLAPRP